MNPVLSEREMLSLDQDNALFGIIDITTTDELDASEEDNHRFEIDQIPPRFEVSTSIPHMEGEKCIKSNIAPSWSQTGVLPEAHWKNQDCILLTLSEDVGDLGYFHGTTCMIHLTDVDARYDSDLDWGEALSIGVDHKLTEIGVSDGCPVGGKPNRLEAVMDSASDLSLKKAGEVTVDASLRAVDDTVSLARDLDGVSTQNDLPRFTDLRATFEGGKISVTNDTSNVGVSLDYEQLSRLGTVVDEGLPIWWDSDPATNPNTRFEGYIDHAIPSWEFDSRCLSSHYHWGEDDWNWHCHRWETDEEIAERVAEKFFDNLVQFQEDGEEYKLPPETFVPMLLDRDV